MSWLRSYTGAPIRVKEHGVGFLNLNCTTPGFFTPDHAERLLAFCRLAVEADGGRIWVDSVPDSLKGDNAKDIAPKPTNCLAKARVVPAAAQLEQRRIPPFFR